MRSKISVKLFFLLIILAIVIVLWISKDYSSAIYHLTAEKISNHMNFEPRIVQSIPMDPSFSTNNETKMKTILYWTKMFESTNMYFGDGDIFASCPVRKCFATNDRTTLPIEDFDMIIFHAIDMKVNDLPRSRSLHQRYVFLLLESPISRQVPTISIFNNYFNWTMTYRRDSTLMRPYGEVVSLKTGEYILPHIPATWQNVSGGTISDELRKTIVGKTKMIAWFVSNCNSQSNREYLVNELKRHIPVDIYGNCGTLKCGRERSNDCLKMLEKTYYFYLALENSLCHDYITEKPFNALMYDVVPIVYGRANYKTVLPPGSYIDMRDFATSKQLTDYLLAVSQNPKLYMEFFKWKSYFKVVVTPETYSICQLCKKLHEVAESPTVANNVYNWWTNGQCLKKPSFNGAYFLEDLH